MGPGSCFIARVLHALGLSGNRGRSIGRIAGSRFSWLTILGLSGYVIVHSIR